MRCGGRGATVLAADDVMVDADEPEIPLGIAGEPIIMPTRVRLEAVAAKVPRHEESIRRLERARRKPG